MAKLAKQLLSLVAERDRYKQHADTQAVMIRKQTEELAKQKACLEALYLQRENGTAAIIAEHMGPNWGVNFEMKNIYSPRLKEQLEVTWPIHTARSSSKSTNLDGGPQEQSGERTKGRSG